MSRELISTKHNKLIYKLDGTIHQYCQVRTSIGASNIIKHALIIHEYDDGTWRVISDINLREYKTRRGAYSFYHERLGALIANGFHIIPVSEYQHIIEKGLGLDNG